MRKVKITIQYSCNLNSGFEIMMSTQEHTDIHSSMMLPSLSRVLLIFLPVLSITGEQRQITQNELCRSWNTVISVMLKKWLESPNSSLFPSLFSHFPNLHLLWKSHIITPSLHFPVADSYSCPTPHPHHIFPESSYNHMDFEKSERVETSLFQGPLWVTPNIFNFWGDPFLFPLQDQLYQT